jgi:hypothetical protein
MGTGSRLLGLLFALLLAAGVSSAPIQPETSLLRVPLRFEPNRGQSGAQVHFLARGTGYGLFLTDDEAVMRFELAGQPGKPQGAVLRVRLAGAQPARPHARLPQGGRSNYLTLDGSRPPITDVPHYSELVQRQRYPGIDLVYYGNDDELEYDFVLAPQADPRQIAIAFHGAERLSVAPNGDLHIDIDGRTLVQRAPVAFQYAAVAVAATADATRLRHSGAERIAVAARYAIGADGRVRFQLGAYDSRRPLVIDPVLAWATCLGGSADDHIRDLALGSSGDTFLVGETQSADFPTAAPLIGYGGGLDAFVSHMNAAGSGLHYSTYIGGTADEQLAYGVAVNGNGEAHVVGRLVTAAGGVEAFLVKLNAAGNAVVYSSVFGGVGTDIAESVALDSSGNAVVVGWTDSSNFPILNAVQNIPGGNYDGFIRRHAAGGALLSSSYLGGVNAQFLNAVAVGVDNSIYIGGQTQAQDPAGDAFMAKLTASAGALLYSRVLAGSQADAVTGIALDGGSRPHLVGYTYSSNFPTLNPIDGSHGGASDAFFSVLEANGTVLASTFLGDLQYDTAEAVALGPGGDVFIAGTTGAGTPWLSRISASFQSLVYSLDFGTGGVGTAVRVDAAGAAYVAGWTANFVTFPSTPGAFQACTPGEHGFVAKVVDGTPTLSISNASAGEGAGQMTLTLTLSAAAAEDVWFDYATANGSAIGNVDYSSTSGTTFIPAGSTQFTRQVTLREDALDEADETFTFRLSNIRGATGGDVQAVGTIVDNDLPPSLSIDNGGCSVNEGNAGSANCLFVVRLGAASGRAVGFNTATANGTAIGGADFTAHASTARSIPAGQTTLTIAVPVLGDTLDENNESFALNVSSVANATPGSLSAIGTINDDDAAPTLSVDNNGCAVAEGNSGSVNCSFVARLSALSGRDVGFTTATANGSATAGSDYTAHSNSVRTLAAGNRTLTVLVPVIGDIVDEANETFALNFTAISNATPGTLAATGTINDDDEPVATGTLHVRDATLQVGENAVSLQVVVERVGGSSGAASVSYATANGSAQSGLDYGNASGTLSWAAGDASAKPITLTIINDPAPEALESFTLTLSQASGATLGAPATSTISIVDGAQMLFSSGFE